jgi:DNA-binding NarL/FixJ family response regulator
MRYDRGRQSLDRHATYIVATFVAGSICRVNEALRLPPPDPRRLWVVADDLVGDGLAALEARDWGAARSLLEQAVADGSGVAAPDVLDGLADARWWGGDVTGAIEARELAVGRWRAVGRLDRAVRGAVWIAIEYADALGHEAASDGWFARARTMADGTAPRSASGWIALGRAALATDPSEQAESAADALHAARAEDDGELEVLALARLGWARVAAGHVDAGITVFNEAMATATAADFEHVSALGDLCCQLARATEVAGERGRFASWLAVVRRVNSEQGYPPLAAFCATCCAELHSVDGNWQAAEEHLRLGIDRLRGTGHRARCGPPVAKLAELLVLQGRLEEAAEVLGEDDTDSTLVARARLALGRGEPDIARALAERWIRRHGEGLLAVGALSVLGHAAIAEHDRAAVDVVVERIASIASLSGNRRAAGAAALLEGQAALDAGDRTTAAAAFERALDHYAGLDGLLDVAHAHLGLAEATKQERPAVARVEATVALAGFEAAGAPRMADVSRAALRELGDRSHVGRKGTGVLTDRELEVLRLLARGVTNVEIADRLFISVKTAGNHVSNILAKIGARSRTEAAAFAALHPEVLAIAD